MRIAILGAESSHAVGFASKIAGKDGSRLFDEIELVGVYADKSLPESDAGVAEILKNSVCKYITNQYDVFIDQVDGVLITSRHGNKHLQYAKPYLTQGIPVWIDKPICNNVEEIIELVRLSKKYDAPVCGGSSLVFSKEIKYLSEYVLNYKDAITGGHITAPIHMNSVYDGFWFYASHAVQMMLEVFGIEARCVSAEKVRDSVHALYEYDDFSVSIHFGTGYTVTLYKGNYNAEVFQISNGNIEEELQEFFQIIKCKQSYVVTREWIAPVFVIDATIRAFTEHKKIEIRIPEI